MFKIYIARDGDTIDGIIWNFRRQDNPLISYEDIKDEIGQAFADNSKEISSQGTHFRAGTEIKIREETPTENRARVKLWQ